jgi:GNAT superfamily N-acetyltransferase
MPLDVGGVVIRRRVDDDLDRCEVLGAAVQTRDGYPRFLFGTMREFLATSGALAAWVAESDGDIVGHAALHPSSSSGAVALAEAATGRPSSALAFVSRLLVSPDARGLRLGERLLGAVTNDAVARGLVPVLDVAAHSGDAIALYERCGWRRAGAFTYHFRHGQSLDELLYLAPDAPDGDTGTGEEGDVPAR